MNNLMILKFTYWLRFYYSIIILLLSEILTPTLTIERHNGLSQCSRRHAIAFKFKVFFQAKMIQQITKLFCCLLFIHQCSYVSEIQIEYKLMVYEKIQQLKYNTVFRINTVATNK